MCGSNTHAMSAKTTEYNRCSCGRRVGKTPSQIQTHYDTQKHQQWLLETETMEELKARHSRELEEWKANATEEELEELKQCSAIMTLEEQKETEDEDEIVVEEVELDGKTYYYCEENNTYYDPETGDVVEYTRL